MEDDRLRGSDMSFFLIDKPSCIVCGGLFLICGGLATCQECGIQYDLRGDSTTREKEQET